MGFIAADDVYQTPWVRRGTCADVRLLIPQFAAKNLANRSLW